MTRAVDVVVSGSAAPGLVAQLRDDLTLGVVVLDAVETAVFDGATDRWVVGELAARVLIDTAVEPGTRRGLLADDDVRAGMRPYLAGARHGFPNHFTVTDDEAARYVAQCLGALWRRGCTRIEVKPHVQAQYSRGVDRVRRKDRRTAKLADFEFTTSHDREEDDEDYRGPAVLIGADGTEIDVDVHLLALYQPVDNAVRWSGRVQPSAALADLHRGLNQPVHIRVGGRPAVPAVLVDNDPWGGSHITGAGQSPYPLPLLAELARLDG